MAPAGARPGVAASPHATQVFDLRAMGLPQVMALGHVQVFDLNPRARQPNKKVVLVVQVVFNKRVAPKT